MPEQEKVRHFHLDHAGTPRIVTGNGGSQIATYEYYPFGEQIPTASASSGILDNPERHQFTGHERDTAKLDYMVLRYYTPVAARFLTGDPVLDTKAALRESQLWNRYAYVTNNPLKYTDPDGRYRTFYKEKPMTHQNLDMDTAPPVIKAAFAVEGALLVPGAGSVAARGLTAVAIRAPGLFQAVLEWGVVETAGITISSRVVLGSHRGTPSYVQVGENIGATTFSFPSAFFDRLSPATQEAANIKFLDRALAREVDIYLSSDPANVMPGSGLDKEIRYLLDKGYEIVRDTETNLWKFVKK